MKNLFSLDWFKSERQIELETLKVKEQELKNKNKNFEFFNAKQKEFGVTGSGQTASGALWNSLTGAPSLRGFLDVVPNETTKAANTRKKKILLDILGEGNLSK